MRIYERKGWGTINGTSARLALQTQQFPACLETNDNAWPLKKPSKQNCKPSSFFLFFLALIHLCEVHASLHLFPVVRYFRVAMKIAYFRLSNLMYMRLSLGETEKKGVHKS